MFYHDPAEASGCGMGKSIDIFSRLAMSLRLTTWVGRAGRPGRFQSYAAAALRNCGDRKWNQRKAIMIGTRGDQVLADIDAKRRSTASCMSRIVENPQSWRPTL